MADKEKNKKKVAAVTPICDNLHTMVENSSIPMEERGTTPLRKRVQEAAKTAWSGESVAVAISDILGPHARKEWNLPVGSHRNPFWKLTKKVSSPKEIKKMLSKSLMVSCSLGSAQLVHNFLEAGADPNCDPGKWGPVHSAAYGGNAEVMRVLLEDSRLQVNNVEKRGKTALHIAAMKGNYEVLSVLLDMAKLDVNAVDETGCTALHTAGTSSLQGEVSADRFPRCISLLMNRPELKMNKPDKDGLTALSHTVMFSRKDMTQAMLKHKRGSCLNVDTFLASHYGRSIREVIQNSFPDLVPDLPSPLQEKQDSPVFANKLLASLQKRDLGAFQTLLKNRSVNLNHWYDEPYHSTITEITCQLKNRQDFLKELLKAGANPNTVNPITTQSLIHLAAKRGCASVLQILLHAQGLNINVKDGYERTSLHCLTRVQCRDEAESANLQKAICLLLGDSSSSTSMTPTSDIHAVTSTGESALHIASRVGDKETVLTLLRHGADIMYKVADLEPPLSYIDPTVMEQFLDECIDSNDDSPLQQDYMLTFDYNLLSSTQENRKKKSGEKKRYCDPEMPPLKFMSSTNRFRYLLKHPVIASFLTLKWRKIRVMYITNFLFYSLFLAFLTWYSFLKSGNETQVKIITTSENPNTDENEADDINEKEENDKGKKPIVVLSFLTSLVLLLMIREVFQFFMSPKVYIRHSNNWLLWVIILSTLNVCGDSMFYVLPECTAISLLLAWTQFVLLIGDFPALSIQIEMLKTVAWTFLTFIICYCPLFFAFGFSFFTMFRNSGSTEDKFFSTTIGMSMLKVFIMFAGEFEASEIPFDEAPYTSHIIFTIFVFLVSIVLLNLLNGLAVSDAQAIRKDAEILSLSARVKLVSYMENMSPSQIRFFSVLDYLPSNKLKIFPNRGKGKVEVNGVNVNNTTLDEDLIRHAVCIASKRKEKLRETDNVIQSRNEELEQMHSKLDEIEQCQHDINKQMSEIKKQLNHLNNANNETKSKLSEILTTVQRSYGTNAGKK